MRVDLFDFPLPRECIAVRPAVPRDSARLLRVPATGPFQDLGVRDLPGLLDPGDVLVVNDTRVIPARLKGRVGEGGVEVTLHLQEAPDRWRCFARPARKLTLGRVVTFAPDFTAEVVARGEGGEVVLSFNRAGPALTQALEAHGRLPLPPYMGREDDARDREDYQTTYASHDGAVAAPTAGLHLTPALFQALADRGVACEALTLHVGAGTFLPVTADDTADHVMHAERGILTPEVAGRLNQARAEGRRIVAVGTTVARLLESAADDAGVIHPFETTTRLFLVPGARFKVVDRLMTNFHLPRSTLFMLVSAFAGLGRMQAAYAHAIKAGYRFYSYGDACLLDRADLAAGDERA
ncbi:tRNA preQ1(34) S-adenosylmethionine ribosyltransferase-isomerase QueA [Pararhodospirillum oryzae]|uniref:S-adenosylmethionine:tRNA ribosyltransferase-isomerase n=1 Tax=Pararhodospirillum oryzae TaxID=478448 RepID=A0A512H3V4_9PROT|nr:tRNA preQ1(34) S-adenosylmethionine ribosyltransferase-isomerase QueA [Pararhodospirillum oryzae]GEO80078.1 S-adenosylmethionine:tRNA ribosyltransferase-isomerase [Pararhodospirillum oryzae]